MEEKGQQYLNEGYAYYFDDKKCDFPKALEYFEKAAKEGNARAQYIVGECYYDGVGCVQNTALGSHYNQLSADQNYPLALFANTIRNPKSKSSINSYIKESTGKMAEERDCFACYLLSLSTTSRTSKLNAYHKTGVQYGHITSLYNLAVHYRDSNNDLCVGYFRNGAEKGHAPSQCGLGGLYDYGKYVENDDMEAKRWYEISANNGFLPAQYNLAIFLLQGRGGEQDIPKGMELLRKAADNNHTESAHRLGVRLMKENPTEGMKYLTIASNQHNPWACITLGECFEKGIGISMDWKKAIELYSKASHKEIRRAVDKWSSLVRRQRAWKWNRLLWIGWYQDKEHSIIGILPRDIVRDIASLIRAMQ